MMGFKTLKSIPVIAFGAILNIEPLKDGIEVKRLDTTGEVLTSQVLPVKHFEQAIINLADDSVVVSIESRYGSKAYDVDLTEGTFIPSDVNPIGSMYFLQDNAFVSVGA